MSDYRADVFLASLNDQVVRCTTVEDAVAVNTAGAVLDGCDAASTIELERLAVILDHYRCYEAARRLCHLARRQRAADLLTATLG